MDPFPWDQLPADLRQYIANFLDCVSVMSLRLTSRRESRLKMPDFRKIVARKLAPHFPDRDVAEVLDALYASDAIMSGSFILDCLYDTNYHHDVDVYDPSGAPNTGPGSADYGDPGSPKFKFMQYMYSTGYHTHTYPDLPKQGVYMTREFVHPSLHCGKNPCVCHPIQIIPVNLTPKKTLRGTVVRNILATFDLDICKNGFDGRSLYVRSWIKLIYRFDHIMPGTSNILESYRGDRGPLMTADRINKYTNRGFHITSHPDSAEILMFLHRYSSPEVDRNHLIEVGTINLDLYSTARWSVAKLLKYQSSAAMP